MPTGFTQRFRGKIQAAALWLQGGSEYAGPTAYVAYSTASASRALGREHVSKITGSSGATVWSLPVAGTPGVEKDLILAVTSGMFITAPSGGGFNGSTLSVAKSTYDMRVSLVAMSSIQYAIKSAYPDTTAGGAAVGGLTLSTTT